MADKKQRTMQECIDSMKLSQKRIAEYNVSMDESFKIIEESKRKTDRAWRQTRYGLIVIFVGQAIVLATKVWQWSHGH